LPSFTASRLRGLVAAFLHRVRDESNRGFFIALRELTSPTGLLEEVTEAEVRPIHQRMESIVRDLLGPDSSRADLQFCTISILNQCFSPILAKRPEPTNEKSDKPFPPRITDINAYADQVVRFSLGGIRAIVETVERRPPRLNGQEKKGVK
jgi:TetR/AcrR family transcriptional regulator, regulator of cefoperazone and chloramphenicol sensitivity